MNTYGTRAMQYWRTWLPLRFAQIQDPQGFFASLGEQVEDLICSGCLDWQGRDRAMLNRSDYLTRVGQLTAIRASVTEVVMADMVYLEPEPQTQEPDLDVETQIDGFEEWVDGEGMPVDPAHPLHAMLEDPDVSADQYRAALKDFWAELRVKVS